MVFRKFHGVRLQPSTIKNLSKEEIVENIRSYLDEALAVVPCINNKNKRPTSCRCVSVLSMDDGIVEEAVTMLNNYEQRSVKERQLFLHGILAHGLVEKENNLREKKRTILPVTRSYNYR